MSDDDSATGKKGFLHPEGMRAVRELTVGLVHEVNNMLGVIIGNAHLAHKSPSDIEGVQKYVREIRAAAEEGRVLMQDLAVLAAAEPTWGRELSLNDAVKNAASTLDAPAAFELDGRNPSVELHPSMAHDALIDVIRFMAEAKEVTSIEIETRARGSEVELVIEDDGPRPSEKDLGAMFTPFAKIDRRPKVGMRLAKLADLAARFGGRVTASARSPQGLRVLVTLPAAASGDGPGVALPE